MKTKICPTCGSEFVLKKPAQIYCSHKCWRNFHRSKHTTCANCGNHFSPAFHNERFCSDHCRIQFFKLGG